MKEAGRRSMNLTVNGKTYKLFIGLEPGEVAQSHTLAHTLRDTIGLTGTKTPCDRGECGGCAVIINGWPVPSCSVLTIECEGDNITTIEGVANPESGDLHPIQKAFIEEDAIQCGMCTPGIIMAAKALLDKNCKPTEAEVREALAGNICRCTGYVKYAEGVLKAAASMRKEKNG